MQGIGISCDKCGSFCRHPATSLCSFPAWKMSDKQPGNPYIWYAGYLNLERVTVEQFSFSLKVGDHCRRHCGYVAFDDVTLSCEAENKHMVLLRTCEVRALALPGCPVDILEPIDKGTPLSFSFLIRPFFCYTSFF